MNKEWVKEIARQNGLKLPRQSKLPTTCAKCTDAQKYHATGWECSAMFENWAISCAYRRIPCARGKLPKVPAWCSRRKA